MGSFNTACSLTNVQLLRGASMVSLLAVNEVLDVGHRWSDSAFSDWQPASLPWVAESTDYGCHTHTGCQREKMWHTRVVKLFFAVADMLSVPTESEQRVLVAERKLTSTFVEHLRNKNPQLFDYVMEAKQLYPRSDEELEKWESCFGEVNVPDSDYPTVVGRDGIMLYLPWSGQVAMVGVVYLSEKVCDLCLQLVAPTEVDTEFDSATRANALFEGLAKYPGLVLPAILTGQDYSDEGGKNRAQLASWLSTGKNYSQVLVMCNDVEMSSALAILREAGFWNVVGMVYEEFPDLRCISGVIFDNDLTSVSSVLEDKGLSVAMTIQSSEKTPTSLLNVSSIF